MSEDLSTIIQLLRKHDYIVEVHRTDKGCRVVYPVRREFPQHERFEVIYTMDHKKDYVEITTESIQKTLGKILLMGPHYAHKALIMFHIIKTCNKINYNQSLIQFFINKEEVAEPTFLQSLTYTELSNTDLQKENALIALAVPAFQHGFDEAYEEMASKQDIDEGYKSITGLFFRGKDDNQTQTKNPMVG